MKVQLTAEQVKKCATLGLNPAVVAIDMTEIPVPASLVASLNEELQAVLEKYSAVMRRNAPAIDKVNGAGWVEKVIQGHKDTLKVSFFGTKSQTKASRLLFADAHPEFAPVFEAEAKAATPKAEGVSIELDFSVEG